MGRGYDDNTCIIITSKDHNSVLLLLLHQQNKYFIIHLSRHHRRTHIVFLLLLHMISLAKSLKSVFVSWKLKGLDSLPVAENLGIFDQHQHRHKGTMVTSHNNNEIGGDNDKNKLKQQKLENNDTSTMAKKNLESDHSIHQIQMQAKSADTEFNNNGLNEALRPTAILIPRELQFTTPYGHLAVKEWGNSNAPNKILCLHGWLDNSGSFDCLIPHLLNTREYQDKYHILAMDEPGIGFSSHKPAGADYSKPTALIEIKRIVDRLRWSKLSLMGHSMGANHAFIYACLFPDQVENVISIDMTQPITSSTRGWNNRGAANIKEYLKYENQVEDDPTVNDKIPVYSEKEALKRIMDSHGASLNEQSARVIMKRGAKKRRWGYTFTRDIRLRVQSIDPFPTDEVMLEYLKVFQANLLIIRGKQSIYQTSEQSRMAFYELYKKQCRLFKESQLDGTHHLHMNNPEPVAEVIKSFLDETEVLKKHSEADGKPTPNTLTLSKSKL